MICLIWEMLELFTKCIDLLKMKIYIYPLSQPLGIIFYSDLKAKGRGIASLALGASLKDCVGSSEINPLGCALDPCKCCYLSQGSSKVIWLGWLAGRHYRFGCSWKKNMCVFLVVSWPIGLGGSWALSSKGRVPQKKLVTKLFTNSTRRTDG